MGLSLTGFERVYRRELPFVWAAARRFGVHPAVIDDAVQDVFLTAYRRWGDLRPEVSPRAWLYGVTRRVAFRYRRSDARTVRRKAAVAVAREGTPAVPHQERDEAHDVDTVLAVLEPTRREVFVMAELLEMSGPEIAAQLQIPLNTVYSRLRLARRELEPRLRRGVAAWAGAVRERDQPSREQAQRSWTVLMPLLGPAPVGGGVIGAWSVGRMMGMAVAVGVLVTAAIAGRPPDLAVASEGRAVVDTAVEVEAERGSRRGPGSPTPVPSRVSGDAMRMPAPVLMPSPALRESPSPSNSRSARRTPEAREVEPDAIDAVDAPSAGLEEEVRVLDRANAALREGDAAHALQWLAEHEQQFPAGRLLDVRKATRVRALCRLGRDAQARAEAAALREHARSNVARNVPLTCHEP